MADPLDELRAFKTQLRELRWTTQVDSLKALARESAKTPGARGGISKATIGNIINPDNPTMPRWETFETFVDTCLRLIDRAGVEPPAGGGDRRAWRLRYVQVRDALGDNGGPSEVAEPEVVQPDSATESLDPSPPRRRGRAVIWLATAAVLVVVVAVVVWQTVGDGPESSGARADSGSFFCEQLGGQTILEDSFADAGSGWPQHTGQSEYVSGSYQLTIVPSTVLVRAQAPTAALLNTCTEVVMRSAAGFGGFGLWCRGEPGELGRRYVLWVTSLGLWGIAMTRTSEPFYIVLASQDNFPGMDLQQETRIGASCRSLAEGVELVVSVNGRQLRHVDQQSLLTAGSLGVLGWTWLFEPGSTTELVVENIQTWELPATE
ncbi:hypothetical protein H0264_29885 [Nocardia huaxiensis]|uniref:Uncharacterized protein n=1 Tax=Nocardia huaxiensis TaxID=2755382 RepID=A0A7D6ZB29_9NOCA|nr:hypothetical protein [Nocardia huaxiensis]QLY29438.1 hypothetical protein H0264_29885 [Nocardia huaxiensis]